MTKYLAAGGTAMGVVLVFLLMAPFAMYVAALSVAPGAVQAMAADTLRPTGINTPPQGGQKQGPSPGPLIAKLPKPQHKPWHSIQIPLIPLFANTPPGGFDVGGLPWGQCTWYTALQRGIVAHADGKNWVKSLASQGYKTSNRPTVGAILSWRAFSPGYGVYGHVALVVDVDPDGSGFTVAEANVLGEGLADVRWVPIHDPGIDGFVP